MGFEGNKARMLAQDVIGDQKPFTVSQAELRDSVAKVVAHVPGVNAALFGWSAGVNEVEALAGALKNALRGVFPEVADVSVSQNGTTVFQRGEQEWESDAMPERELNPLKDYRVSKVGKSVAEGLMVPLVLEKRA